MRPESPIPAIAARQWGVVTRKQLLAAGFDPASIARRIRAGRLHPIHRGVYLVGHSVPTARSREMAAVLACGQDAVLSHRDAAALHELLPHPARPVPVNVSVAERDCRRRPGIRVHRVKAWEPGEIGTLDSIPITSPARTVLDLAAVNAAELEQVLAEAERRRLVRPSELIERSRGRPGRPMLRSLIEVGPSFTRSEAERRLLRLIRSAALPSPETNARLCGYEVDFLWRDAGLAVEVDGYAFHRSRQAFERDRARDADMAVAGYTVVRITWRQLVEQPEAVVARIAGALASR